jgi:uncharacterized protein
VGGDEIRVEFDMSPHVWVGDRDCAGKVSIYRGPILLAFDPRFNDVDPENVPETDLRTLNLTRTDWMGSLEPWLLVKTEWEGGSVVLCDFASAGMTGTTYRSWLPARGMEPVGFNRASAIWNRRP